MEHDEGKNLDLGVCGVRYVFAPNEVQAKELAIKQFAKGENFGGKISQVSMSVDKIQKTAFWALWSRTAFWAWDPSHSRHKAHIDRAKRTAIDFHKYINR